MALVLHDLQLYGLFSFCTCYYCLIPFLCCIKLCMFKNFHLMPHWTCPLQTFAVDTAKSFFQPYSTATFLQLHIFSMENALNNDYFEELFPVSVWILRPPSRYSIVWKLSLGNYLLCKSSRHKDAEIQLNVYAASMCFDHNKFHTCRCVTAVTFCVCEWKI